MLLVIDGKPRGIRCDITGVEKFDSFVYYSLEGKAVSVDSVKKTVHRELEVTFDLDLCEDAYNQLYEQVKKNLGPLRLGTVKCDMSARYLTGKFTYWTVVASMVQVDLENPEPMQVTNSVFDLNISREEVEKLVAQRTVNRAKPFVQPKVDVLKREVLKIVPQPVEKPEPKPKQPEPKPKSTAQQLPEPEIALEHEEITLPDIKKRTP